MTMHKKSTIKSDTGQGPLDRLLTFTRFKNETGFDKTELHLSLREFDEHVGKVVKRKKQQLPFFKAATFGNDRSLSRSGKSYRTNANVKGVDGLEADMDKTTITPAEAAEKLATAGIAGFVHTTPSHTAEKPRWRVFCPFSTTLPPEDRYRHQARLNGLLGGGMDPVSFTISQAFYAGSVASETPVETYLAEGRYLDKADDLDAGAIGRPNGQPRKLGDAEPAVDQSDNAEAVARAQHMLEAAINKVLATRDGERTHTLYRSAFHLGGFIACGTLDHETCLEALLDAAGEIGYFSTYDEDAAQRQISNGLDAGGDAPNVWQDQSDDAESDFDFMLAPEEEAEIANLVGGASETVNPITGAVETSSLTFLTPADCAALPARRYVIKGLLGEGDIAAIVGQPGTGKSLLAPRLAYAVAQGETVFGKRVKQGGVFYVAAEDGHGMRARLSALRGDHGDANQLYLVDGVSDLLGKKGELRELQKAAKERRPKLIVIDTLAVAFPGLEENSAEGMGLVVKTARALAQWGASVVLIHHDTKAGDGLPRGHSLLNGALDVSIQVKKSDDVVTVKPTKNRNGTTEEELAFTIETRVIGKDEDGDPATTAICVETDAKIAKRKETKLTPSACAALSILRELGQGTRWVSEEVWRKACIEGRTVSPSEKADTRRAASRRAFGELVRTNKVTFSDGKYRERNHPSEEFHDDFDDI